MPTLDDYRRHLSATAEWLMRSIEHGRGGSCAHYMPVRGWSRPYPETTGYLIPTLLALHEHFPELGAEAAALRVGEWLLEIQRDDGAWHGGLHPEKDPKPSVFNSGQILLGINALVLHTGEQRWRSSGERAARWLAEGIGEEGVWQSGDYRAQTTPSYYTHVTWPMLDWWRISGDDAVRDAAERFLDVVIGRRLPNDAFAKWGFGDGDPAFTHTIAYTLRGLQGSALALDRWGRYGEAASTALDRLLRLSETADGRLPGAFDEQWRATGSFVCLTGNAQLAECCLIRDAREPDPRWLDGARQLLDFVCDCQRLAIPWGGLRGAVGGSRPLHGAYMRLRYPNWAAKFHCDALMRLIGRLENGPDETPA